MLSGDRLEVADMSVTALPATTDPETVDTTGLVANPPNVANSAICGSPTILSVIANSDGMTIVARAARIAAGTLQVGFHTGCAIGTSLGNGRKAEPDL